ncbi:LytTR family DNA-binding domain-containing protein [Dyadobacter chenwenxiniae]|uniref:LytTR family DNA-binding domain-containing protein n=1 Tax=Dyadobacter chenwenxiniae TaxID=2906456 RepID=A0A9X1TG31_9BACT|nr:LytTR family DNA-binding domain-containing protein [Dyadobacter chenwenxiniae]MCF0063250.1 LytTR family DNA-binding domain-containing protein [Dyadobacter chenwenxiniae]UON85369.1 LytTR family DNA-binding domain-containing protein [Dyadobacter chenwenxiniae]
MINCLIVDDAPVARQILVEYCKLLPVLRVVAQCSDAFEAREKMQQLQIDLLLMDINMPVLSGIDLLKTLKNPPLVIFTTAYKEFATDAFDLAACDYLLKPFSIERFIIAIDRVIEKLDSKKTTKPETQTITQSNHLLLRTEGRINKLNYDQIVYLEANRNNTKVVTMGEHLMSTNPLSSIETHLPNELFFRVHRSFIVNLSKITGLQGNRIILGKSEVPLGGNYKDDFLKVFGV